MATPYSRARRGSLSRASSKSSFMDCSPTGQARPTQHLQPHYSQQHRPSPDIAAQQLHQHHHHHIPGGSRQRAASMQALQSTDSVAKDPCPSSSSTLLQRRSCVLPTMGFAAAVPSTTTAAPTTATITASAAVAPYQYPLTTGPAELPVHGPALGLQLPAASSWQDGMGSSEALPVRQALHSFIATSCEKPLESKEEARSALEGMFQVRAEKIRRAIEQGKLATAEALKHKVIRRRKSLAIGGTPVMCKYACGYGFSTTYYFAPTEARRNSASSLCPPPGFMGQSIGNSPARSSQEPYRRDQHGTAAQRSISVDRPSAFGLSDEDLMTSFTTFTDRFSDSLLSRSGASEDHGGNSHSLHQRQDWVNNAVSLSPPSLEKSPVTPDDLLSRPAWMSLMPCMAYPASDQQLPMVTSISPHKPQHRLPIAQSSTYAKGDPAALCFQTQAPAVEEAVGPYGLSRHEDHATETCSHYVKYFMCSQEPWDQPSLPDQQPQDPQWQAAMMAMMMDP